MKKILYFYFFVLTFLSYGQQDSSRTHWVVKANPFAWMNPAFPTIAVAVEARPMKRLGVQVEYGFPTNGNIWKFPRKADLHYAIYRGEIRSYLYQKKETELYLGFETFLIAQKYTENNGYFWKEKEVWRYDAAHIRNNNWGWVAKFGWQQTLGKRWLLDTYLGTGLRKKLPKNSLKQCDLEARSLFYH